MRPCPVCGELVGPTKYGPRTYCSMHCKRRAARILANERGRTWQKTDGRSRHKKCKGCDSMSVRFDADYCSTECRFRQHKQLVHIPAGQVQPMPEVEVKPKGEAEPRLFYGGKCTRCGVSFVRSSNGGIRNDRSYCSTVCARGAAHDHRRARERAAYVEPVYRYRVFERDNYVCQLCMKPCRTDVDAHHMQAPTIDHVLALANGGMHQMSNVQTAHRICNCLKSDRLGYVLTLAG